ncbi:type IV secretory system conjugative DNA transfer family protein [Stieleria neptunia]|uniref:type IV secretory system conjugative DNA transfer family protein n=1 Tax=Stieleria neptunia TaxID=2527979 RepID=UPI001E37DC07|nr:type IV secretory system conjugative DNA transfer family protein [Stieleria neptunia]
MRENVESKLFLGVTGGKVVTGQRMPDGRVPRWVQGGVPQGVADDRHHFLLAGSRGGKGRAFLVNNLIALPSMTSSLTIDPKGDLAATTARYRAEALGQEVAVTDMFDCSGSKTRKFRKGLNVIDGLCRADRKTFTADAMLIADALVVESESIENPHWDECTKEAISGLCAHIATHSNYSDGQRNLVTVWELAAAACEPDPNDAHAFALENEMLANDAAGGYVRAVARAFYSRTGDEFASVASNMRRHLSFIGIEAMQDALRGPCVDPAKIKNGSLAWYVSIPTMRDHALKGFKRLCVQTCLAACEKEQQQFGNQAVFFLDEFHALGRMKCIETAIAQFAGLGVKLVIVLQDLSQIQRIYPKSWQTFLGNAGTLQTFAGNDEATLSYLSKRVGEAVTVSHSSNQPSRDQVLESANSGMSWALGNKPLLTPTELEFYFARDDAKLRQLVLRPGYRPMVLQRCFYDKSEYFAGRFDRRDT